MIPLFVILPFVGILALLMVALFIHIGYINSGWKIYEWPEAVYYVAIVDRKTRNDFWHVVFNNVLIAAFAVLILYALGKLGHV